MQDGTRLERITSAPMRADEQGYSGARLERHTVTFHAPDDTIRTSTLITKEASLTERRVLERLAAQSLCVPFSHTLNLSTDAPALVCQQDLRQAAAPALSQTDLQRKVAQCLARMHHANLACEEELAWLPRANRSYFEDVILVDFRAQLARAMDRPAFAARNGEIVRQMEEAVEPFLSAAGRYPGFKYMGFLLHLAAADQLESLRGPLLRQLLHGA